MNFNINSTQDSIISNDNVNNDNEFIFNNIKTSETSFTDNLILAEASAQWLRRQWVANNFYRNGFVILGQDGVAGVGDFFVELYKTTGNASYYSWARQIAVWLIAMHGAQGYPAGKWPNRIGFVGSNYSGFEQGSAGIGSFFINLYGSNNSFGLAQTQANEVDTYLDSIDKSTPTGTVWQEKDSTVLTDSKANPNSNRTLNGTSVDTLADLNNYDGNTYDTNSVNSTVGNITSVEYNLYIYDAGVPIDDFSFLDQFISDFNVSIAVRSDIGLSSSEILIYNAYGNGSWEVINSGGISTSWLLLSQRFQNNISNYVLPVKIRVNSTAGSPHTILINTLNITVNFNNAYNSTSVESGAAGIGNFYLDMYDEFGGVANLDKAKAAANYTIEQATEYSNTAAWDEKGNFYTTVSRGAAGIGKFFLRLNQTSSIPVYGDYAKKAANWLIANNATVMKNATTFGLILNNESLLWGNINSTTYDLTNLSIYSGMDACAGIGNFLLDLGKSIGGNNIYKINATYAANWLTNTQYMVAEGWLFGVAQVMNKWRSGTSIDDYSYDLGTTGALVFLNNIFLETSIADYTANLSRGMEWVFKTININATHWGFNDNETYNIPYGLAGVGLGFLQITLKKPSISIDYAPSSLEFDDPNIRVEFSLNAYGSNINESYIFFSFGNFYLLNWWFLAPLNYSGGDNYFFEFPGISSGDAFHYFLVVFDENGTLSLDNNGTEYVLNILDSFAPATTLVPLYGEGIGAGTSGILEIKVDKNVIGGANLSWVFIDIPQLGITDNISWSYNNPVWPVVGNQYVHSYQIDVGTSIPYGTPITVNVTTADLAGNQISTIEVFSVIDTLVPSITKVEVSAIRWIPQFTPVEAEVEAVDLESGLNDKTGVFIKFSTDGGRSWQTAYLEKRGAKYIGAVPGQIWFVEVFYVFGAEDIAGNVIYVDANKVTYNNVEDIPLYAMYSYKVILNWFTLLLVVGVIALITVFGYLLYSKRGGYLEKMRRKSKAAATGLAIKERFTNFYYNLVEKLNNFGEKISKALSGSGGKIKFWLEEHLGERTKKVFRGIGRFLIAFPKGIINGFRAFVRSIGKLFTKVKGSYIVFYTGLGFLIVITTVVQFFMEAGYPIRAVFFANLGFFMFISGIVGFLVRFIYKLSYK
jgi:hypothetical protein